MLKLAFSRSEVGRPIWKTVRRWAAVILLLAIGYPLSLGPVFYCLGRGWIPPSLVPLDTFYWPIKKAVNAASAWQWSGEESPWWEEAAARGVNRYSDFIRWFGHIGRRHREAASS